MKKHCSYFVLALLCASTAHADTSVTPVRDQTVDESAPHDPAMRETCKAHFELMANKPYLLESAKSEGCKKVAGMFLDAVSKGASACSDSFDMNVRNFIMDSMNKALSDSNLYCTAAQAILAPCPTCEKSFISVQKVTEVFSTNEVKQSLGVYSQLLPTLTSAATQNSCPEFAKHSDDMKAQIAKLASELNHAKVVAVRYSRKKVESKDIQTQVNLGATQNVGNHHQEFPAISVKRGSGDGITDAQATNNTTAELAQQKAAQGSTAGTGSSASPASTSSQSRTPAQTQLSSSQSDQSQSGNTQTVAQNSTSSTTNSKPSRTLPPLPNGFDVSGRLSDGSTGFVFSDPSDPSKNYIGFQARDPKTNKLKTYAYVTDKNTADAVRNNPALCDSILKDKRAQNSKLNGDSSALSRGNGLMAQLFGQKNKNKTSGDLEKVAQAQANSTNGGADNSGTGTAEGTAVGTAAGTVGGIVAGTVTGPVTGTVAGTTAGTVAGTVAGALADTGAGTTTTNGANAASNAADQPADQSSSSEFHISSGVSGATGLNPDAKMGLNPDARAGLKYGRAQASQDSASSNDERPSSSEIQANSQRIAQQPLTISNPNASSIDSEDGTSLKDHPNVGLGNGPSENGIRSEIKTSPDQTAQNGQSDLNVSGSQSDSLKIGKIGKTGSSTPSSSSDESSKSNLQAQAQSQGQAQAKVRTASHNKPQSKPKKHSSKPVVAQKSTPKATEAWKQKVAEYTSGLVATKGFATVRYFLLNRFPSPQIGRWTMVDGKTEEIKYNMPADSNQMKELINHPEKLEATFNKAKANFKEVKPRFLDVEVGNNLIDSTLLNQALKSMK